MGPGSYPMDSEPRPPVGKGAQVFCYPPGDTWSHHTAPVGSPAQRTCVGKRGTCLVCLQGTGLDMGVSQGAEWAGANC